ncbi:MAG: hypothetical protein ABI315_10320 [Bacteroidia bacterium]
MTIRKIEVLLIILVITTIGFLLSRHYFFLDEPNILWEIKQGVVWENFFKRFISDGRPVYGWIVIKGISFAESLSGLRYLRIICVILTFFFCYLIYMFLKKRSVDEVPAFIIAALVFCLPGFSIFMIWSECFPQHLSSILSFCAGVSTFRVFGWMLKEERISKAKENLYIAFALLLQIFSLLNYQGTSLAFILPGFFALLLSSTISIPLKMRFTKYYILIFFLSLGLYYLVYRSLLANYHIEAVSRAKIGSNVLSKVKWFSNIFFEASALHLLLFKAFLLRQLFSFFVFFLIIRDAYKKRWADLFFLLLFSILSFLPHLLIGESWGASRNFVLMSVLITFYSVIRCVELTSFFKTQTALFLTLPFIAISFLNIKYAFVDPVGNDYDNLKAKVAALPVLKQDTVKVLYTVPPFNVHSEKSFLRSFTDEFNVSPFSFEWPIAPAIKCFYSKVHPSLSTTQIDAKLTIKPLTEKSDTINSIIFDLNYK